MENKEVEKPVETPKEPEKPTEAQKKEPEKSIETKESLKPGASKYTDEIIEGLDKISIPELDQKGGWVKLLIVMYKEKAYENRTLQEKINALNTINSDLSRKIGVSQERLRQTTGIGVAFGVLYIIAGTIIGYVTSLPDSPTKTALFRLAIGIFVVCTVYHFWNSRQKKNIE